MKNCRVCLVSTVRNPGPGFESFLTYHLATGFEKLYIFFDDPQDHAFALASKIEGVTAIKCDKRYLLKAKKLAVYSKLKKDLKEVQARQILNAAMAMAMAVKEKFDWIFHVDDDEVIYNSAGTPIGSVLAQVPEDIDQIICVNHEALPVRLDISNPLIDITLFKKHPRTLPKFSKAQKKIYRKYFPPKGRLYFTAHGQGKSGGRVGPDLRPLIHNFRNQDPKLAPPVRANIAELVVYHYPTCSFDQYLAKYKRWGNFKTLTLKKHSYPSFHLWSRDAFIAGDFRKLMELYKNHVQISDKLVLKELLSIGCVEKNMEISKFLKKMGLK